MAEIIEDRVKETTLSTGTGNITLAGAMLGFRAFSAVCAVNDTFHAAIVAVDSNGNPSGEWEVGYYTYSATNTITRSTVRASSNSNNAVNFGAGTKQVFIDLPAYQIKTFATVSSTNASAKPYITDSSLAESVFTAMTFSDEFDGNTLDLTKWTAGTTAVPDNATQNFSVAGGCLNIWPQVDGTSAFFNRSITSDTKAFQKYGYFECKAKLPAGLGIWPGFVLASNENGITPYIDVIEAYPGGGTALPWGTASNQPVNYRGNVIANTSPIDYVDSRRYKDYVTSPTTILSDDFHTYGVYWTPDLVQYYFDGVAWGTPVSTTAEANMQQRMHLIFKLWVNSVDSGTATTADTPQGSTNAFKIDYVRVWGLATTSGGGTGGTGSSGLTMQQIVDAQQATTHEQTLIRTDYEWQRKPLVLTQGPFKEYLPDWFKLELGSGYNSLQPLDRLLSWLVVERGTAHTATNAAVEMRDLRVYIYSQSSRTWSRVNLVRSPTVDLWRHRTEGSSPSATYTSVADGVSVGMVRNTSTSVTAYFPGVTVAGVSPANQMFHGYGSGITTTPSDWRALFVAVDHRLTLWNSSGTDDRTSAQFMVNCGADHYPTNFEWSVGYAPGAGNGRFRLVKNEWQTSYCVTPFTAIGNSYSEIVSNPPHFGFLP